MLLMHAKKRLIWLDNCYSIASRVGATEQCRGHFVLSGSR